MLLRLFPPFCNRVKRKLMEAMTINPVPKSFEIPRLFSLPSITMAKITTPQKRSIDNWTDNRWYSWVSSRFLAVCDSLKPKKQRCNVKNHSQTSPVSYLFDNPEKALLGRGLIRIYPWVSIISLTSERYYKLNCIHQQANYVPFSLDLYLMNTYLNQEQFLNT